MDILKYTTMTRIYNYMFHYNPYEELWYAIPRDKYVRKSMKKVEALKHIENELSKVKASPYVNLARSVFA